MSMTKAIIGSIAFILMLPLFVEGSMWGGFLCLFTWLWIVFSSPDKYNAPKTHFGSKYKTELRKSIEQLDKYNKEIERKRKIREANFEETTKEVTRINV